MDQVEKMCDSIALISRGKLVLSGSMREVKAGYPRNRVHVVFSGDEAFLQNPEVEEAKNYAGVAELKLHTEAGAQKVLAEAVARGTVIHRFEVKEPTLEEIFIEQVRASFGDEEAGGIVDA
jgi:ABC-2 type transport system ATP-binding protein